LTSFYPFCRDVGLSGRKCVIFMVFGAKREIPTL
jgi:hypothetical protein